MIRFIKPRNFRIVTKNWGPYLYYYNAKVNEINSKLVQYIDNFANFYIKIDVLEIDRNEYKKFQPDVKDDEMNTIYLYYKGSIKMREHNPCIEKLTEIFLTYLKLFNVKTLKRANNIGKDAGKFVLKMDDKDKIYYEQHLSHRRYSQLKSVKNKMFEKIIVLPTINELYLKIFIRSPFFAEHRSSCNYINLNNQGKKMFKS